MKLSFIDCVTKVEMFLTKSRSLLLYKGINCGADEKMLNLRNVQFENRSAHSFSQSVTPCYIVHPVAMVLRLALISSDHEVHESILASTYLFSRLADGRI